MPNPSAEVAILAQNIENKLPRVKHVSFPCSLFRALFDQFNTSILIFKSINIRNSFCLTQMLLMLDIPGRGTASCDDLHSQNARTISLDDPNSTIRLAKAGLTTSPWISLHQLMNQQAYIHSRVFRASKLTLIMIMQY
jgi:hypothetical protein